MNRRSKKFSPKPSKLALSTLAALLALPTGQALANTSYPSVPLIWQSGATVIKPNILLFLDTSGSMAQTISGKTIYNASGGYYSETDYANRAQAYTRSRTFWGTIKSSPYNAVFTTDKPRMVVAKEAITNVIRDTRNENRWGLATFLSGPNALTSQNGAIPIYDANSRYQIIHTNNNQLWYSIGAEILSEIQDIDTNNEHKFQSLIRTIKGLPANTNTPIPSAYYELIRYYRGMDSSMPSLARRGAYASGQYKSPIQYRCQKNYIIFISDGEPTGTNLSNQLGKLWHTDDFMNKDTQLMRQLRNHLSTPVDSGVTPEMARIAYQKDLITGGSDLEGKSFDDATGSPAGQDYSKQNITTFSVAFGQRIAMLEQVGARGGGKHFDANSPEALSAALIEATTSAARENGFSAIAPAVNTSADSNGDTVVQAAISSIMSPTAWSSEIRFYKFNSVTGKFDLANYAMPKYTPTATAIFSTTNGVKAATSGRYNGFDNALFGISPSRTDRVQGTTTVAKQTITPITVSDDAKEYQSLMRWLLRWDNSDTAAGAKYRNRSSESPWARYLGDISGDLLSFGDIHVRASNTGDYDRKEFLAAPSNDGMLHVYQANTGLDKNTYPYVEKLRYIPGTAQRDKADDTIMRSLVFTAEKSYGSVENPKQNFLADSLIYISTDEGKTKNYSTHTVLGGFGSGARGAFAINVGGTDHNGASKGINAAENTWTSSVPLWDTSTSHFGNANNIYKDLGYHFGQVKVGYVADQGSLKGWKDSLAANGNVLTAAFMTSGFDNPNKSTLALYVLDHMGKNYAKKTDSSGQETAGNFASTSYGAGGLVKKIEIGRAFSGGNATGNEHTQQGIIDAHDGLTSPQGIDINNDNIVDLVYAGDYKGNIWRFDLRGDKGSWFAHKVYESEGKQPLVAEPALLNWADGKVGIYFGTGSNLYQGDLTANGQQSLYGIFDDYKNCTTGVEPTCTTIKKSDLIVQTMEEYGSEGFYISSKNAYTDKTERKGFYIDVPTGYRVTTTPVALKVALRSNVGAAIWNIEKLSGTSQVLASCTPDMVSASGIRFIADAYSGQASRYVTWGKTYAKSQDVIIGSIPYKGSSSRSVLVTSNNSSVSEYGTLRSGKMPERDSMREPTRGCSGIQKLASGSTEEGTSLNDLECIPGAPIVRRVSWREIF